MQAAFAASERLIEDRLGSGSVTADSFFAKLGRARRTNVFIGAQAMRL
jgi:hypothetical protein